MTPLPATRSTSGPASLRQFDIPGAATVIGGLVALIYALGATERHGWGSASVLSALAVIAVLVTAFAFSPAADVRPSRPAAHMGGPDLVAGTAVMLGVTGILVGTVFLTSLHLQTTLGYSALRAGLGFLPFPFAITAGTVVARHALAHASPRAVAGTGLGLTAFGAALLSTADAASAYSTGVLPGLLILGLGVGGVFVPVSVTAMAGIPPQHAGMASGFLMTGHEVGAPLGVAVLSAVATSAGTMTSSAGVTAGFARGLVAAAVIAVVVAAVAVWRMPATPVSGPVGHLHH